jgi:hypothetical protein
MTPTSPSTAAASKHAPVNEHRPTRERKRVDLFQVHRRERVLVDGLFELGRSGGDESIAKRREIAGDLLVLDNRVLLPHLGGRLEAELHVLLGGVAVLRHLYQRLRDQSRCRYGHDQRESRCYARWLGVDRHDRSPFVSPSAVVLATASRGPAQGRVRAGENPLGNSIGARTSVEKARLVPA